MLITDKTALYPVLSGRQKVGFMELLRSGCSSRCGRAAGAVVLVSAVLVTTEPLARPSPDDILAILTRQMATFGGPLVLAGAGPAVRTEPSEDLSPGAVDVADASRIHWPAGKPNPFDPGMIARGAVLPIIGEVREPSPEARASAPRAMAAADSAPEPPAGAGYTFAELFGPLVDLFSGDDAPDEETAAVTEADIQNPVPEPAVIASAGPGEGTAPPLAEPLTTRTPSPAPAGKTDNAAAREPAARRSEAPASESRVSRTVPADRTGTPAFQAAPADAPEVRVLAAAEDEPAPPEVNYTFSELFGKLADFFSGDGGMMADAPEHAPADNPALASSPEVAPEVLGKAPETALAAAGDGVPRLDAATEEPHLPVLADAGSHGGGREPAPTPRALSEAPLQAPASTDFPPAEAVGLISRKDDAPRDEGSVDLFAWIADAFTDAPEAESAAADGEPAPAAIPENAPAAADPAPEADLAAAAPSAEAEDAPRDEPQEITGLFAWIADAFTAAPGAEDTATDEATPPPEGPSLDLAEIPDTAVSAGSSTTPMEWKDPDREMPAPLAELLGAPELARAAENMRAGRPEEKGVIGRLADLLASGGGGEPRAAEDDGWAVKNVETAMIPPPLPKKPLPVRPKKHYLTGVVLKPGGAMSLGKAFREQKPCIEKKRGSVVFCLEPVQWPRSLDPYFRVDSILYQGTRAIVRYDEGVASTYHVLFDSRAFDRLVSHFKGRYGSPTERLNRSIAPLAAPRQPNPIAMWRSVDPVTNLVSTLEIRKYDDSRGGFPDTRRGAIMLYHTWSEPIFPLLSTLELMLLDPR